MACNNNEKQLLGGRQKTQKQWTDLSSDPIENNICLKLLAEDLNTGTKRSHNLLLVYASSSSTGFELNHDTRK